MKNMVSTLTLFESIKHIDEDGNEYWLARELKNALDYAQWRRFSSVIDKAIISCKNSNISIDCNFAKVGKIVKTGISEKNIIDYKLSRYACYIIAQNSDSNKSVVALAQTYFAIQTRKQEVFEKEYSVLTEDEKRIYQRELTRKGNNSLNNAAREAGVKNFDRFHNAGYKGLYNGETADDIAKRKGLRYREDILDNMCSEELVDNLFRIVQTEQKIIRDNVKGDKESCDVHYDVGMKVRRTIKELGGTMPEDLPNPNNSLKELNKKNIKK